MKQIKSTGITIPEVQYIKFLDIYWSNPAIRHTLVFTAGSHETCLDLLGYGERDSNAAAQLVPNSVYFL